MRNNNTKWAVISCILMAMACHFSLSMNREFDHENEEEEQERALREEWWLHRYADPSTGNIPTDRLDTAMQIASGLRSTATDRSGLGDLTWQERGPNNLGGHANDFCFDWTDNTGNALWIASNGGGLWKTSDAFSSTDPAFQPVAENTLPSKLSSIEQHPTNPNILYVSAYSPGGIWKSTDRGTTWAKVKTTSASLQYFSRVDLAVFSNGNVLAADHNSVYLSTNGGSTWSTVFSGQFVQDLEVASDQKVYLLSGKNVYRSTDLGLTWSLRSTGLLGNNYFAAGRLAVAPSDPNRMYALIPNPALNYGPYGFYRSSDGGGLWEKLPMPASSAGVTWAGAMAVDPNNPDRVMVGSLNFSVSSNGGATMTNFAATMHVDQQCVAFVPFNSSRMWIANDGGIHRSTNAHEASPTVQNKNGGFGTLELYAVDMHPTAGNNELLFGGQDNGTYTLNSAGAGPFVKKVGGGDGSFCHFDRDQPNIRIASGQNNLQIITNNAWASSISLNIGGGEFIAATDYDPLNNVLYTPQILRNGYAYVQGVGTDNVVNRVQFSLGLPNYSVISAITVSPNAPNTLYLGNGEGYVFKVVNAATPYPTVSIIRQKIGNGRFVSCIAVEKGNDNHLVVTYSNYGVLSVEETLDGGGTWLGKEGNLPDMPVNWFLFTPGNAQQAMIATDLGVWATTDLTAIPVAWTPLSTGMNAHVQVMQIALRESDGMVAAATYGRGVFTSDYFVLHPNNGGGGGTTPPAAAEVCVSKSNFPWEDWISGVQISNINHVSGKTRYSDFTDQVAFLGRNTPHNLILKNRFSYYAYDEYWKIWIDYNQNNILEEPQEIAFAGMLHKPADGTPAAQLAGTLTIPANAFPGLARMRVSMKRGGYPSPCEALPFGEVEDYSVQIAGNSAALMPGLPLKPHEISPGDLRVFPNPAVDFTNIYLDKWRGRLLDLELRDVQGQMVWQQSTVSLGTEPFPLNIAGFNKGIYVLRVRSSGLRDVVKKLVVTD